MNEQTANLIKELATKLGTTADHLWGILCAQAPIQGGMDLLLGVSIIGAYAVLGKFLINRFREINKDIANDTNYEYLLINYRQNIMWAGFWYGLVGIALIFVAGDFIKAGVSDILNPSYFAFQAVMDHIPKG